MNQKPHILIPTPSKDKVSIKGNQLILYPDKTDDSSKPVTFTRK